MSDTPALTLRLQLVPIGERDEAYVPLRGQRYLATWADVHDHQASFSDSGHENAILSALQDFRRRALDAERAAFLGDQLRSFLGERWAPQEQALKNARAQGRSILLSIATNAHELFAVPWELLRLKDEPASLAQWPNLLVCYELLGSSSASPWKDPLPEGGRILFAWAGAQEVGRDLRVPHEGYLQHLQTHAQAGFVRFSPQRDVLEQATWPALQERLALARAEERPYSILHILCHGGMMASERADRVAGLLLKSAVGPGYSMVGPDMLGSALVPHAGTLQTVVLSVCHGAGASIEPSRLGSLALAVHAAGIPAVVASRTELSKRGALVLADVLYRALLVELCSLETALMGARAALMQVSIEQDGQAPEQPDYLGLQVFRRCSPEDFDLRPLQFKPYRGLSAFEPAHRRFFFGREAEVAELIAKVDGLLSSLEAPRILLLASGSGMGKSSLVCAGLMPALEARGGWKLLELRPTGVRRGLDAVSDPRTTNPRMTNPRMTNPPSSSNPGERGSSGRSSVEDVLNLLSSLPSRSPGPVLVYVDALEEALVRLTEDQRRRLGQSLGALASPSSTNHSSAQCVIVCSLRLDYVGELRKIPLDVAGQQRFSGLVGQEPHWMVLRELGEAQVARLIHAPAARVGLSLDPAVALKLEQDLRDAPEAMPLLEHALEHLWLHRTGRRLLGSADFSARGLSGLLEQTAEHCVQALSLLDASDGEGRHQQQLRRVLLALVDFRGDIRLATRRAAALDELVCDTEAEGAALAAVLSQLELHRLVVSISEEGLGDGEVPAGSGEIWLVHEALVRSWPLLESWLQAHAALMPLFMQLREDAKLWNDAGTPMTPEYLRLRGERLRGAEDGHASGTLDLTAPQRAYLLACRAYEEEALVLEEERRVTRAKLTRLIRLAVAAWAVVGVLAVVAYQLGSSAETLRQRASDLFWVRWARERSIEDPPGAVLALLQVQDHRTSGWLPLASSLLERPVPYQRFDTERTLVDAVASPLGSPILLTDASGTLWLWSADSPSSPLPVARSTRDSQGGVSCSRAQFSPLGDRFAIATRDAVEIWAKEGRKEFRLEGSVGCPDALLFSVDGRQLLVHTAEEQLAVWALERPEAPIPLPLELQAAVPDVLFSADGRWLLAAKRQGEAGGAVYAFSLLPPSGGQSPGSLRLMASEAPVLSLAQSGDRLAALLESGTVLCLEGALGQAAEVTPVEARPCWELPPAWREADGAASMPKLRLSPTGSTVAALSGAGSLAIGFRDDAGAFEPALLLDPEGDAYVSRFTDVRFSVDGRQAIAERRADAPLVVTLDPDLKAFSSTPLLAHQGSVVATEPVAGERWIVTAGADGALMLWPQAGAFNRWHARGFGGANAWVERSAEGTTLAFGQEDGEARIWRSDWRDAISLVDFPPAQALALHPTGEQLAVLSASGLVLYTRDAQDRYVRQPERPMQGVRLAFSPDGTLLALGLEAGGIAVYESQSLTLLCRAGGGAEAITALAFAPGGARLAVGTEQGDIRIVGVGPTARGGECAGLVSTQVGSSAPLSSLAWSPDGRWLLGLAQGAGAFLWSGKPEERPQVLLNATSGAVLEPSFSADGRRLVLATDKPAVTRLYALDHETPKVTERGYDLPLGSSAQRGLTGVQLSASGQMQLLGSSDGALRVVENDPEQALRLELRSKAGGPLGFGWDSADRYGWMFTEAGAFLRWPVSPQALREALESVTRACLKPPGEDALEYAAPERLCAAEASPLTDWAGEVPK